MRFPVVIFLSKIKFFYDYIAKFAGIEHYTITQSTMSAIVSYWYENRHLYNSLFNEHNVYSEKVLVIDMGGASTDICKFELRGICEGKYTEKKTNEVQPDIKHVIEAKYITGMMELGGQDIDECMFQSLNNKLVSKYSNIDWQCLSEQSLSKYRARLRTACSDIKKKLAVSVDVQIDIVLPWGDEIEIQMSQSEFKTIIQDLFSNIDIQISKCIGKDSINKVLFVGGCCQSPVIRQYFDILLPEHITRICPNNCRDYVAKGNSIIASLQADRNVNLSMSTVLPYNIGVFYLDKYRRVFRKNTSIPCTSTISINYGNHFKNTAPVAVFEGNSRKAIKNNVLGFAYVSLCNQGVSNTARICIKVYLNKNGLVTIDLKDDINNNNSIKLRYKLYLKLCQIGSIEQSQRITKQNLKYMYRCIAENNMFILPLSVIKDIDSIPLDDCTVEQLYIAIHKLRLVLIKFRIKWYQEKGIDLSDISDVSDDEIEPETTSLSDTKIICNLPSDTDETDLILYDSDD